MKKSINNLKAIVTDGMRLISKNSSPMVIRRYPNNIIKIYNRSVSWKTLQDILINGEYELEVREAQPDLFKTKQKTWGGYRFPGPGKQIGRPPAKDKKVPVTLSIRQSVKQKLLDILEIEDMNKNEFFENLISNIFDDVAKIDDKPECLGLTTCGGPNACKGCPADSCN